MELICPSCEARYQVPDASVGEKGRQVSCMSCGHSWHAFPPLILGSSAAPPTTAAPGIDFQTPPRPGRSSAAFTPSEPEAPSHTPEPPAPPEPPRPTDPSRSEQLAEIREMLAEVQSEERAAAALVPDDDYRARAAPGAQPLLGGESGGAAASAPAAQPLSQPAPQPSSAALDESDDEDDDSDPLRRRMAMHDRDHDRRRTDVERLRKRHDRRARRQQRARDAGSGAFLTGFLLIVMIGAAMTAIYVLQPQIVARMPGTEPMLAEYVETVDGLRIQVAEGYESARSWLMDLLEKNA